MTAERSNHRAPLDAAIASCLYFRAHWPRAAQAERYPSSGVPPHSHRSLLLVCVLTSFVAAEVWLPFFVPFAVFF